MSLKYHLCARLRLKTVKFTDQRISLVSELVTGIRARKDGAY